MNNKKCELWSIGLLALGLVYVSMVYAGETSIYRYKLTKSSNDELCKHMQTVYTNNFKRPWDTPYPATDKNYGEHSKYAFPKFESVEHDPKLTYYMRYFGQPSSPEFEAIQWREGRSVLNLGGAIPDSPVLWAEFDIDNDGKVETVLVNGFFSYWQTSTERAHNGQDSLAIFDKGSITLKSFLPSKEFAELIHTTQSAYPPPRLLSFNLSMGMRPFIYNGVTYISAYDQQWQSYPPRKVGPKFESITIIKYKRGGEWNTETREWGAPETEKICEFKMIPYEK